MNHSSYINHEVVFRLTQYIVPVAFGVIMAVGLVGNVLVISVVSVMTGVTCPAAVSAPHVQVDIVTGGRKLQKYL